MKNTTEELMEAWRQEVLADIRCGFYPDSPLMPTGSNNRLFAFVEESNSIEGIDRMPSAQECQAHLELISAPEISIHALCQFVHAIQPGAFLREEEGMDVRVGAHRPISGGLKVLEQLHLIINDIPTSHPFEIYCRYETLHPFMDGNGRSGRALWLGMMIQKMGEFPDSFLRAFHYQALTLHDSRDALRAQRRKADY